MKLISTLRCTRAAMLLLGAIALPSYAAYDMENLDRGTVAINRGGGEVFISWRWLGNESDNVQFNVYRNNTRLNSTPISDRTNFIDTNGSTGATYSVRAVVNGQEQAGSTPVGVWNNPYLSIPLQRPNGGTTPDGVAYTYSPNDASVGDLDGDGQYEIVLKWDPSNSKDNSQSGYTGNVYLDAYELDGTRLWRVDLGRNIRAGAHYTQFIVYDLDSDGRAEVACRTSDGTVDGNGRVIGNAGADHRNSSGYVLSGPEFLTIFDGRTGGELASTNYVPARGSVSSWGDSYGNRVDRFLAGVAYLDGEHPSLIMSRGYYTRAVIAAWDWRNNRLSQRWVFDSNDSGNGAYAGQGAHSLTIGDVDQDGRQEIIFGAAAIDDNGLGLYSTGLGHGDALHLSDMNPGRAGLEVFMVHECPSCYGAHGVEMHDAATGRILWSVSGENSDVGRGVAMDIDPRYAGYEAWGSRGGLNSANGQQISSSRPSQMNFAAWWDGDLLRELLDGNFINKWNYNGNSTTRLLSAGNYGATSNNGTKANPSLSGDLFGDWREEVIWRNSDNSHLMIFSTTEPSDYKFRTLMHDPQYRVAIAWQNVAYNQPPHPSFFLGEGMSTPPAPDINLVGGPLPSPTPTPTPTPNGQTVTVEENTTGFCGVDGTVDSNNGGFSGSGFANTNNVSGTGVDWRISVQSSGNYMLTWRYANGSSTNRSGNLLVDGNVAVSSIAFNGTGSWTSWSTTSASVYLSAGTHAIRLQATTGEGLGNIDYLRVDGDHPQAASCSGNPTPTPSPSPTPMPTPSPTPTPTPTPSPTPIPTPSPTPTVTPTPAPGGVSVSVNINNDWGGGYCASLELTNNTGSDVTWNVSFDVDGTVSSLWNGEYSQSGSTLTVSGVSWNAVLNPGEVDSSVGFCANR